MFESWSAAAATGLLVATALGGPLATSPQDDGSTQAPVPVVGNALMVWEQPGPGTVPYHYLLYVDEVARNVAAVCRPGLFAWIPSSCSASLPTMMSGVHRLNVVAKLDDGAADESPQSTTVLVVVPSYNIPIINFPRLNSPIAGSSVSTVGLQSVVEPLVTGLNAPSSLAIVADGTVFIAQRSGEIVVWRAGRLSRALALEDVLQAGDVGLIGIAAHPDYPRNGYVFVAYTAQNRDASIVNRMVRFRALNNVLGESAVLLEDRVLSAPPRMPRVRVGPDR